MENNKWLDKKQVAQILGKHPASIIRYRKAGKLEGYRIGGTWRFKNSDVLKFLEDCRQDKFNPWK